MAINQQPISRSVITQGQNVSTGSGLATLNAAASSLSQIITEKLNDVAIEQAAIQGQQDALEEKAPEKLSLPFTRATKAYNQAVANTEARRQIISAQQLIDESLANNMNPATFTNESPAKFKAELQGIRDGILQHARPETRAQIALAIDSAGAQASVAMLKHSIDYDNNRMQFDFSHDLTGLLEARRNAAIAGDTKRLANIDSIIESSINDYSEMNQQIKQLSPYIKDKVARQREVDKVLGDFSAALNDGTTTQFLSDLADNKQKLPFNIWDDAVKAVVALDQEHSRLMNDMNAQQVAQVSLGIQNGSIQSLEDINNYPALTVPQKLTAMKQLNAVQAQQVKDNSKLITAQQNILSGRPEWNNADTKNTMFKAAIQKMELDKGQIATLADMEASILGTSEYPASGMQNIPIGTNVPAFDSTISEKLTSEDPIQTAQAAMVYNDMVNVKGKPNSINLTGDALSVASLFNEMYVGGTTPDEAANQAINRVLKATEPQMAQRIEMFNRDIAHIDPKSGQSVLEKNFKEVFGYDPQVFGSSEAFKVFSDKYKNHYLNSSSPEAALNATKYEMQKWGTSKYFDTGFVGQPVPEKEIPITQVGNAFDNQMVASLQGLINRNNALRAQYPDLNIPSIEWADQNQTITGNESQEDKVFKKLTIGNRPRLKINGQETDVVLIPSPTSRLDNRINYLFGIYDKFNNLNPLKDVSNQVDQVARFAPTELSIWAPQIATAQTDKQLSDVAMRVQTKETRITEDKELAALERKSPAWTTILGLTDKDEYRKYIEERAARSDKGRLDKIIESLKGDAATRTEITSADNVGINTNLEPAR